MRVILLLLVGAAPVAAEILAGVARLAIIVDIEHPVEGVAADALRRRLAAFLAETAPAITRDDTSPDRLRLTVAVRPHSSSALRGFWLPFSGTYGIGPVRLVLERAVQLPGQARRTVAANVWQRDRVIATRWSAAGAAIAGAVQELLDELATALRNQPSRSGVRPTLERLRDALSESPLPEPVAVAVPRPVDHEGLARDPLALHESPVA